MEKLPSMSYLVTAYRNSFPLNKSDRHAPALTVLVAENKDVSGLKLFLPLCLVSAVSLQLLATYYNLRSCFCHWAVLWSYYPGILSSIYNSIYKCVPALSLHTCAKAHMHACMHACRAVYSRRSLMSLPCRVFSPPLYNKDEGA